MDEQEDWQDVGGREAAEQHIQEIRAANGVENSTISKAIVANLEAACKVLSEQLYEESTHFLLELIQNADDNTYNHDDPRLELTYDGNYLRVDCNEAGFSRENVTAICNLGQSSKVKAGQRTKCVGEKGIGFKSVFKVADVVWISSGDYAFKFDVTTKLGMISPIVSPFAVAVRPGWTSFYLQLHTGHEGPQLRTEIKDALSYLDPKWLSFLRKLRTVVVNAPGENNQIRTAVLRRHIVMEHDNEILQLSKDQEISRYLLHRYMVGGLPREEQRDNVASTEVTLGFPIDSNNVPHIETQQVYAFLPINDFGLSVVVQGDFILTANREGIETSKEWNQALLRGLVDAFQDAVTRFNRGPFRYTWPRYLPEIPGPSNFFKRLRRRVIRNIQRGYTLEARDGTMQLPESLIFVPPKYRDDSGCPITLSGRTRTRYLSGSYSDDDYKYLNRLMVKEMDFQTFMADLKTLVFDDFSQFCIKPAGWHSSLANILANDYPAALPIIRQMRLIKLRTDQWVSADEGQVFFPGHRSGWDVPGGVEMLVVDPSVAVDPARRRLYAHLGVTSFNPMVVQQLVIQLHSSDQPPQVSTEDLLAQTIFLFSSRWRNPGNERLWVATVPDDRITTRVRGNEVYIDDDGPFTATQFFAGQRISFKFLHPDYLNAHSEDRGGWLKWLEDNVGLSKLPRLASHEAPFDLSGDFRFVMQSFPSSQWLQLLCDNWKDYYGKWLDDPNPTGNCSSEEQERLCSILSEALVGCRDNIFHQIRETYLPLGDLLTIPQSFVPLIDLPEPSHQRWQSLKAFHVGVKNDAMFYLTCLNKLSGSERRLSQTRFLLSQIQARCNGDEQFVREYFSNSDRPLIFVPYPKSLPQCESSQSHGTDSKSSEALLDFEDDEEAEGSGDGEWYHLDRCLWHGPRYLNIHVCLNEVYPGCKHLLKDVLQLPDVGVNHLIDEATAFTLEHPLPYMIKILQVLHNFLARGRARRGELEPLRGLPIWPIRGLGAEVASQMGSCSAADEWFVADQEPMRQIFGDVVPILAFNVDDQQKIRRVMEALDVKARYITKVVRCSPRATGIMALSTHYTQLFRSRYPFIARLMMLEEDQELRKSKLSQFRGIEVYTADRMAQLNTIQYQGREVRGKTTSENVVLIQGDERIELFVRSTYLNNWRSIHELALKLTLALGIEAAKGIYCIQVILNDENPEEIHAELDRWGIPRRTDEDQDEDFSWMDQMPGRRNGRSRQGDAQGMSAGETAVTDFMIISEENIYLLAGLSAASVGGRGAAVIPDRSDNFGLGLQVFGANGSRATGAAEFYMDNEVNEHLQFLGELEVSSKLEQILGNSYNHETHWTSPHREKAGVRPLILDPLSDEADASSAFTIQDTGGAFTGMMAESYTEARLWRRRPPTWHLEVKASYGGLDEEFLLKGHQFERARRIWTRRAANHGMPSDILVLVRVINVDNNPKMVFLVDPWRMYQQDNLGFMCEGFMKGRVIQAGENIGETGR